MERSTILNGKFHYKWPFSIAFCMFTRGYLGIEAQNSSGSSLQPSPVSPVKMML
jgi:hypothetical protein